MRKLLIVLVAAVLICTPLTSCQAPRDRIAMNAESGIQTSVEIGMREWNAYIPLKHPSLDTQRKVKTMYENYQAAMLVVVEASSVFATTGMGFDQLEESVKNATLLGTELVQFLIKIGVIV